ncbi:hypothetical protein SAMN05421804_10623 [Proteiniclasticum ruminis]|jgi:hypothetical protein|uniref:Uncharacterized protein n=1 Tax=Proteiniclasticum ruminis TaxID=398199 RepID=A0A1G8Q5A0_9CLOT|nr:hypothetical protein SAMN05421804_10623 [Proteiniclasticum ruminis]
MQYISGFVNIFLFLIIVWLGRLDMQSAVYQFPALFAVIIGWIAIIKSKKKNKAS